MSIKYYTIFLFSIVIAQFSCSLSPERSDSNINEKTFMSPDSTYYPGVYWWWLRCPTTKEAITKDLEEMKLKKIQRLILSDIGVGAGLSVKHILGYLDHASPEWYDLIRHTILECTRLGLEFSLWTGGAPWITPEESQQKLVFSEIKTEGAKQIKTIVPYSNDLKKGSDGSPVYYQDISLLAMPDKESVLQNEIIDISKFMDKDGEIVWDVPAGSWKILRFGHTSNFKTMNDFKFIDHTRTDVYDNYFKKYFGDLFDQMTADERSAVKYIHTDSYEVGIAGWNPYFADEFVKRRGYDPVPYLPVLAGQIVENEEVSKRFSFDYKQTISDLIAGQYQYRQEVAHQKGLLTTNEASGPHQHWSDALLCQKYSDLPMGEFWAPAKTHRTTLEARYMNKEAVSAAHIYGKNIIPSEAFTSVGPQWEEDPWLLKSSADRGFCEGINQIYFHTYSHSPSLTAKPGYVYYAGSHFNRNITWWDYSYDWVAYLSRCQYMLQAGLPKVDVCFYYGDGIYDRKIYRQEVPELGESYQYDYTNSDAILTRMTVRNGKILMPDGMSYEVLVMPEQKTILLDVLEKIGDLVHSGATVIGPKPETSTGLYQYEKTDLKVKEIADQMWGKGNHSFGKGRVVYGKTIREVLSDNRILPDMEYKSCRDSSSIDFIHRVDGDTEIYYLANLADKADYLNVTFRVTGKVPQIWDPADGSVADQSFYTDDGERISMPLYLDPYGSMFVVFKAKEKQPHIVSITKSGENIFPNLPSTLPEKAYYSLLSGGKWIFRSNGAYQLEYNTGQQKEINVDPAHTKKIDTPWNVSFSKEWGGPEKIVFDRLISWTESEIPGIKYYSGTAVYTNTFTFENDKISSNRIELDLGEMYNIAEVIVNKKKLGTCWKKPFIKDISSAVVPGVNTIEIKITNLWPNRLIGDQYLPEDQRLTETNMGKFTKESPLLPSGLLGPVTLWFYNKPLSL
jgi:hypothetical protein